MSRPHIEYHVDVLHHGSWGAMNGSYPAGTSFAKVFDDYSWAQAIRSVGVVWPAWAWPGGYEIHYITKDCGVLCHQCANKELPRTLDRDDDQFFVVAQDINYEDSHLFCDHCNRRIEPTYGYQDDPA